MLSRFRKVPGHPKGDSQSVRVGYSNTFHDASLTFSHNDLLFAEAIERHTQYKRALWMVGVLSSASDIRRVLSELGFPLAGKPALDIVTTWNQGIGLKALSSVYRKIYEVLQTLPPDAMPELVDDRKAFQPIARYSQVWYLPAIPILSYLLRTHVWQNDVERLKVDRVTHHVAHAANGVYTSPFDECVVMILDGSGEEVGHSFYRFKDNRFEPLKIGRASLGYLYADVTTCCGFSPLRGEEWKVMGLAGYGAFRRELYDFFARRTRLQGIDLRIDCKRRDFEELGELVGGFRDPDDPDVLKSADLAHSFQKYFCDTVLKLAQNLNALNLSRNLVYAGGCALNSAANGVIGELSGFDRVHIPSAPADDGNSLGAVLYEKYVRSGEPRPRSREVMSPYLGTPVNVRELEKILRFGHVRHERCRDDDELVDKTSRRIADGLIVGWMQGRAEFGPRALGNRSILADPRREDMKETINARVKFRENYRPLAPSILEEFGDAYFEAYQPSPYMDRTLRFRPHVRASVPAVVHVDGTGRLQTVSRDSNPLYYKLIQSFHEKTGVPLVVNTSLNVMGKPMVHDVKDALTLFYSTGLDCLVVGPYILDKSETKAEASAA